MLIQRINEIIADVLASRGFDGRRCYTAVRVPPDARAVIVECSDEGVLSAVSGAIGAMGDDVEYRLLPESETGLPEGLVVASSVADVRKEPTHTSELLTQAVYGDGVEPLKSDGEWYLVRLDDAYVGWIRSWHLAIASPRDQRRYAASASHRVATNHAEVLAEPDPAALPVTDLVIGTHLIISNCKRRGWRGVTLPDGKTGYLKSRSLEPIPRRRRPARDRLAATGLRFLGIPYLWGGSTPKGFDCSGLIQRIFRLNGALLPRDSDLQAGFGRLKPEGDPEKLRTGDLMFFGASAESITHVAMTLPDGLFLHAHGQVRVGSLDRAHRLYEPNLHKIWRLSRDPLDAAL
jgi:cell wall-associated NlpC family hydrolase